MPYHYLLKLNFPKENKPFVIIDEAHNIINEAEKMQSACIDFKKLKKSKL